MTSDSDVTAAQPLHETEAQGRNNAAFSYPAEVAASATIFSMASLSEQTMTTVSRRHEGHAGFGEAVHAFFFRDRPPYWLARLYLCCSIMTSVWIAFHSPWNMQRQILDILGEGGWMLLSGVGALAVIGFLDVLINDIMPAKFHIQWADEHRHQVFMVLSLALMSMVYINVTKGSSTILIVRYALEATFCVLVAVFDTVARVKQVQQLRSRG